MSCATRGYLVQPGYHVSFRRDLKLKGENRRAHSLPLGRGVHFRYIYIYIYIDIYIYRYIYIYIDIYIYIYIDI